MTDINKLYAEIEPSLMPIINNAAGRVARSLREDPKDLVQEARIALFDALHSYDYNRSRGGIYAFARQAVRTAMYNAVYRAASRGRTRKTQSGQGREWVSIVSTATDDLDTAFANNDPAPDSLFEERELEAKYRVLKMRLLNQLSGQNALVFRCFHHPTEDFIAYLRNKGVNEPSNVHVAEFLGLSKNVIDWSVHLIKREFTKLAEEELGEIAELTKRAIRQGYWPMIHFSERERDAELIRNVIAKRGLDPRPSEIPTEELSERGQRVIERYPWGAVLFLSFDDQRATLVLEGRFNQRTGEVIAQGGHWKGVGDFVPYYQELERSMRKVAKDVA
jgi:DNA-directed RNA polymerase specialized sigma24 family protein